VDTPGLNSVSSSATMMLEHGATTLRSFRLDCMMLSCSACCHQVLLFSVDSVGNLSVRLLHNVYYLTRLWCLTIRWAAR
jgi:hypothetical protein